MEFQNTIISIQEESKKNQAAVKSFFSDLSKTLSSLHELGQIQQKDKADRRNDYLNELYDVLGQMTDQEAVLYLFEEKFKCEKQLDQWNFERHKINVQFEEMRLNEIIIPRIAEYKTRIENEKLFGRSTFTEDDSSIPIARIKDSFENYKDPSLKENINSTSVESQLGTFEQFRCGTPEEILKVYSVLTTEKNPKDGLPFMKEEDMIEMVRNNYHCFGVQPVKKRFPINITKRQKGLLMYFMLQCYHHFEKESRVGNKENYALFLNRNFDPFEKDSDPKKLAKNMSHNKRPKRPIPFPFK